MLTRHTSATANRTRRVCLLFCLLMASFASHVILADTIRVAVASNFAPALAALAEVFEQRSGSKVVLSRGSSGKHFAQIVNGAPFDLFFSADTDRPARLDQAGRVIDAQRFTYATGRLVLWSPKGLMVDDGAVLRSGGFRRLAIANPRLAPYGKAAQQLLHALGLWEATQDRLIRGENIAQAFHFVHSGNAELGLVALSQVTSLAPTQRASAWTVPAALHAPIEQQVVLLSDLAAARDFLAFVRSAEALAIIQGFGYAAP